MSVPPRRFAFVQVEIPGRLGPADGRYLIRQPGAVEPAHVLVLAELGAAAAPGRLARRRPTPVDPEPVPSPVPITRATIIDLATDLPDAAAGDAWLSGAGEAELHSGLIVLNRLLQAHRIAAADPAVHPVAREHAVVARVGFGEGERVADGRWARARQLPAPVHPRRRMAVLEPQARVAGLLGGRDEELVAEELALRVRVDLDAGRGRHAALGLLVGLDAAIAELAAGAPGAPLTSRLDELREWREPVGAAAQAALQRELAPDEQAAVGQALARVEAALRARLAARS